MLRHGDRSMLDEDAGGGGAWSLAKSDRARGRRDVEGAAPSRDRAARDADEPAAAAQHGAVRRSGRADAARDARVLPAAADARRPRGFRRRKSPGRARLRARSLSAMDRAGVIDPADKSAPRIAGMFDAIAPRYDLLNHVLSFGIDRGWRRRAIRSLQLSGREIVLDLCTGTGDLAI